MLYSRISTVLTRNESKFIHPLLRKIFPAFFKVPNLFILRDLLELQTLFTEIIYSKILEKKCMPLQNCPDFGQLIS